MASLTRDQVREIDRRAVEEFGLSSLVLMENAGRGCADLLQRLGINGPIVICCGRGNNGGDGYVLARHLDLRGCQVHILRWDDPNAMSADCRANFEIAARAGLSMQLDAADRSSQLPAADWYVDALLGTGVRGEPRAPYDSVIAAMNAAVGRKLAIDIPSGLDCDTGLPAASTVRADVTCTFVAVKAGMLQEEARPYIGRLEVADIGAPRALIQEYL